MLLVWFLLMLGPAPLSWARPIGLIDHPTNTSRSFPEYFLSWARKKGVKYFRGECDPQNLTDCREEDLMEAVMKASGLVPVRFCGNDQHGTMEPEKNNNFTYDGVQKTDTDYFDVKDSYFLSPKSQEFMETTDVAKAYGYQKNDSYPPWTPDTSVGDNEHLRKPVLWNVSQILNSPKGHLTRVLGAQELLSQLKEKADLALSRDKRESEERNSVSRSKRSIDSSNTQKNFVNISRAISWRLIRRSTSLNAVLQLACISQAFRQYSEITNLKFVHDPYGPIDSVDILITFGKDQHGNCPYSFDGPAGELAHSWEYGNIHIDDADQFHCAAVTGTDGRYGVNLLRVLLHEIGHTLGLHHRPDTRSVFYGEYPWKALDKWVEFSPQDRTYVQNKYGKCDVDFDLAFGVLNFQYGRDFPFYEAYFLKGRYLWKYLEEFKRPRYGDPVTQDRFVQTMIFPVDAHVQVFTGKKNSNYFFSGNTAYAYDIELVTPLYQTPINMLYPSERYITPTNVDAGYFDIRDYTVRLFKGSKVYVIPVSTSRCCDRVREISDEYPMKNAYDRRLTRVDNVFVSYYDFNLYFMYSGNMWINHEYKEHLRKWVLTPNVLKRPVYNQTIPPNSLTFSDRATLFFRDMCLPV